MSYGEYLLYLDDSLSTVVWTSVVTLIIYLLIYRRYIVSLFDPLMLIVIISALANATVFYLYFDKQITAYYFYSFVLTEVCFLAGFFIIRPIKPKAEIGQPMEAKWYDSPLFLSVLFYWTSILHMFFQLLTYAVVGLPILMDSRLTTFAGGSGFGFIGRALDVIGAVGPVLLFYRMFYRGNNSGYEKAYHYFYLLMVLFFLIVSGNKTNLVFLVYYLFLLQICMNKFSGVKAKEVSAKISKTQTWLFLCSIPLIFVVIYVQFVNTVGSADNLDAGSALFFRILSFGDVYYMSLPHEVILRMNNSSAFLQLFKDFLGMFRIMPWEQLPIDPGLEIAQYHTVSADGSVTGPNARYNYFALLYFGTVGQAVYCFVLGLIASFIRNTLYRRLPRHLVFVLVYIMLNFNLIYLFQDQAFTFSHDFNIVLFFPLLLVLSAATYLVLIHWNRLIGKTTPLNA